MTTPPVTVRSRLFNLLPALYRLRDAQLATGAGEMGPLQSLLSIVEEQIAILEENIAQLYDDLFIETCAPWVVPYIGNLIGYQQIHDIPSAVASPRAEVANTISFRRRKGTVPVFEQLAADATGWGAHAVEFFQVLATTQCIRNHIRPQNYYAPDLEARRVYEHRLRRHRAQGGCARHPPCPGRRPAWGRPGPLQRAEHRHLFVVAQRLLAY
jgi:hypothetical protein